MDGGGACMNQGIHVIDSYLHLMGPVASVYAHIGTLGHPGAEVEDTAAALLQFRDGGLGVIEATTCAYPDFGDRIDLHGERGSVTLSGLPLQITAWEVLDQKDAIGPDEIQQETVTETYVLHKQVIQDMADAIREDRLPQVNGREGVKSLEVIQAIYRSAREGGRITLS